MKKNRKNVRIKRIAVIMLLLGVIVIGGVQANKIIQKFTNRNPVYIVNSISNAITDGYVENLNMEYIYSDEIGLKINSFCMSYNDINIVFDFKLSDKIKLEQENLEYAYIIYNENNEVYHVEKGTNTNLIKEFIKNSDVKLKNNDIEPHFIMGQNMYITKNDSNIIISTLMSAKDYFPKAKKLYIKVVGVGYKDTKGNYKSLSNSEWNIELNIPEKFYSEQVFKYKLKETTSKIKLERMIVSNTSTIFTAIIQNFNSEAMNKVSIIDENGKEYTSDLINFDLTKKDRIICQFPINKSIITNKMYLKVNTFGIEEIIELEKI